MGVTFQSTASDAPEVEDGLALLRFDGVTEESHPDWAGDGKFGFDDGERWSFNFTLLDDDENVVVQDGEPVEINTLTRRKFGTRSNALKVIKGVLTATENALIEAGEPIADSDSLNGRLVRGIIGHSKSGWPFVESTIAYKAKGKK